MFQVFTGGITNHLYGYYQEGLFDKDTVIIKIYGAGTEQWTDRDAEKENMHVSE